MGSAFDLIRAGAQLTWWDGSCLGLRLERIARIFLGPEPEAVPLPVPARPARLRGTRGGRS